MKIRFLKEKIACEPTNQNAVTYEPVRRLFLYFMYIIKSDSFLREHPLNQLKHGDVLMQTKFRGNLLVQNTLCYSCCHLQICRMLCF